MRVKSGCLTVILMFFAISGLLAQTKSDGTAPQFLFPEFEKGEIMLKNGKRQQALLNYNTVSEKVVFNQDGKVFDLSSLNVDTVYVSKSRFIPSGNFWYEVLLNGKTPLFVEHRGKLLSAGKPGPYGTTSQTSSSTSVSKIEFSDNFYNLELPDDYDVRVTRIFWIRIENNMSSFISEKQFLKLFPAKSEELKKLIKEERIKFDRVNDVVKLMTWLNSK